MPDSWPAPVESVAFIGNYPPRKCGIATFTHDLQCSVAERFPRLDSSVVAINDPTQSYDYKDLVRFEVEEQELDSYRRTASFLNLSGSDIICVQHEFGIYGGAAGKYLLETLRNVEAPVVTTLHTILEHPSADQRQVLCELAGLSARLVVMSASARNLLLSVYDMDPSKIDLIPHGIPDMPFVDSSFYKDKIGVEGKFVLLTFGLLSANKGIEHVIEAMPQILGSFPEVVYIVLGATHPNVVRADGEAYRRGLERRAEELGIGHSVMFVDRFVEIEELKEFIAAADMYVTPYLNPAQITSGTLAYSFGCGKAVISTPYVHASELLADDRGILVPFGDNAAIAQAALDLLRDDSRRHAMRKRAYLLGREMIWSEVAARYMETFERARRNRSRALSSGKAGATTGSARRETSESAEPNLNHLRRLTDSTGVIQHGRFSLPHTPEGYCTDDNARALALTVVLESDCLNPLNSRLSGLVTTYASFLNGAFNAETRHFRNFLSYDRRWLDERGSDDCQGRAIFALGTCVAKTRDENLRRWAASIFLRALPAITDTTSPRAWAHALIGIETYLRSLSGDTATCRVANILTKRLLACFNGAKSAGWPWFEESLTYDNAILSQALIARGSEDRIALGVGLRSLKWLMRTQIAPEGHFRPIGSNGFFPRGGEKAHFDQQPIEAAGMVSACLAAFRATENRYWIQTARVALAWFHGRNDLGVPVIDSHSGGCRDGLCIDRLNMNQGAESTLAYLSAQAQMSTLLDTSMTPILVESDSLRKNGNRGSLGGKAVIKLPVVHRQSAKNSRPVAL